MVEDAAGTYRVVEVSLGDYVLNGGEVAALAMVEAVGRLIPGVVGNAESLTDESHADGLLEAPAYTKPDQWRGHDVPEVLLSGHHQADRPLAPGAVGTPHRPGPPRPDRGPGPPSDVPRRTGRCWQRAGGSSSVVDFGRSTALWQTEGPFGAAVPATGGTRTARTPRTSVHPSADLWQLPGDLMHTLDSLDAASLKSDIPDFRPGDTLKVHVRVIEGNKSRVQIFQGVVIRRSGGGVRETFTVRKVSYGVGVERTFPVHSPVIEQIEVITRGAVRRAKLYYLRDRRGKAAKIKERRETSAAQ